MIDLRNTINRKEILELKIQKKLVNIIEENLEFNKQQKGKERPADLATHIKTLTPKQML